MDAVWIALGTALIVAGFVDVMVTVLFYDEAGLLSTRLYRWNWALVRVATRPLPARIRSFWLSLGIPLMVLGTLVMWLGLLIAGFALLYLVGMDRGAFDLRAGLEPSFVRALYLSGVSMSTLGYGDVTPTGGAFQVLSFVQALMGFTILTLAISYVVNIYQAIRHLSALGADLYHQAGDHLDVEVILRTHLKAAPGHHLGVRLMTLHRGLVEHYEGLRHYPIVYYFHSSRLYPSLPYVLRAAADLAGALRWGLPRTHPAARDPWLEALIATLGGVGEDVRRRFLRDRREVRPPEPIPLPVFAEALRSGDPGGDPWLERFLELDRWMRETAGLLEPDGPAEPHGRYVRWLPFAREAEELVAATAADLGYDPGTLLAPAGRSREPEA